MPKVTPTFRRLLDTTDRGLVLKPLLESYLFEARFPDVFDVRFKKAGKPRVPDNYFHPSTHPLWNERQLYLYLTEPDKIEPEQLSYESRMAVTMGTATHGFIEMCIRQAGLMAPLEGTCVACGRPHGTKAGQCDEYGAADPQLGRRGHMDGVLEIDAVGTRWQPGRGVFELKSSGPNGKMGRLDDNDLEGLKEASPTYYAQVQEYMDLTGHRQAILLVVTLGYPWKIIEIQVPYDEYWATAVREKYRRVRDMVKLNVLPDPCCAIKSAESKVCPMRSVCPVGMMR